MEVPKNVWLFQAMGEHKVFVPEQCMCWPVRDDHSLVEKNGPAAQLDDHLEVVRCDNLGG
jgi:hypothetical protein